MGMHLSTGKRRLLAALSAVGVIATTSVAVAAPASADSGIAVTNPAFIQPYVEPTNPSSYADYDYANNSITGWRITEGNVDVYGRAASKTSNSYVVESGSQAIDLNGGQPGGVEQTLNTAPGSWVTISFAVKINDHPWCAANAASTNESMTVGFADDPRNSKPVSIGSVNSPGPYYTWNRMQVTLPATGDQSRLQFKSTTTGACGPLITGVKATDNTTR